MQERKVDGLFDGGETTVTITLEDDSTLECVVLSIFEAGFEDKEYIAVMPETEAEEGTVYLYRYSETAAGEPVLENIETDEEYEIVADAFDEILDAQEFDELLNDDDE